MTITIDWTFIFSLGSFIALSTTAFFTFYRYFLLPRKERIEKARKELYQPLLWTLGSILGGIKQIDIESIRSRSIPFEENRCALPAELYELLREFSSKRDEFVCWADCCKAAFDSVIYRANDHPGFWELSKAYRARHDKSLAEDLSKELTPEFMKGTKVTKSWVLDHTDFFRRFTDKEETQRFDSLIDFISSQANSYPMNRLLSLLQRKAEDVANFGEKVRSRTAGHLQLPSS